MDKNLSKPVKILISERVALTAMFYFEQDFNGQIYKPGLQAYNLIKKRLQHGCFPVNIAKFLITPIEKNLRTAASELTLGSDFFRALFLDSRF